METNTIKAIRDLIPQVEDNLNAYQLYHKNNGTDMDAYNWGSEKEYNIKGIIAGVKNIIADIKFLAKEHDLFFKISTYSSRNSIKSNFISLNSSLKNKQIQSIINSLDSLRDCLRTYCLQIDKDRFLEFNVAIDELRQKAMSLEDEIKKVQELSLEANKTYSKIENSQEEYDEIISDLSAKKDSFVETLNDFTSEFTDFKNLAQRAHGNEEKIASDLETANENLSEFEAFIEKINDREKVLAKQAETTADYEKKLQKYTEEHDEKLAEAIRLIEEAKKALNYKNAEGLSAAFSHQLEAASSKHARFWWIGGAIVFILATLFIGMWIVTGWWVNNDVNQNQMILNLIGRLSMIPFTIMGAVFCANQYTKQKNIIEDYAYKTTIAKSIIAFSEELRTKDPEQYAEYISTILKEIHQDPLRKRGKGSDEFKIGKESTGLIEKVIELLQSAIKK